MEELNWESRVLGSLEKGQAWVSGSSPAERALGERLHIGVATTGSLYFPSLCGDSRWRDT